MSLVFKDCLTRIFFVLINFSIPVANISIKELTKAEMKRQNKRYRPFKNFKVFTSLKGSRRHSQSPQE